jgi:phenylacetate-CoA ligase
MDAQPESAWPSRESLDAEALASLGHLLQRLRGSNAFQARKLSPCEQAAPFSSWEEFAAHIPFTTKQELVDDQRLHPLFGSNLTFPLEHYTRYHQTSGTSGSPLRWLDTTPSWNSMVDLWVSIYRAAGVAPADHVYFAFSFGPFLGFWLAYDAGERLGCLCLPGGGLSSQARLRAILDLGVTVLCCTPTYAIRLGEVAAEEAIDLSTGRVRVIIVAGEPGGSAPATRRHIESLWPGARVFDHHGLTEVGPVTHECPVRPGTLHVLEPAYHAEILDPRTLQPVPPGGCGELVLTNLFRTGSPLLRYRTGDLVQAPHRGICACGRASIQLEGGILGRADDMVVVRGVNIYPSAVDEIVRRCGGVAEYRVVQTVRHALPELEVEVEPQPGTNPLEVREALSREFQLAFSMRVPVTLLPGGSLPRFEMKARRWVSR